MIRAIGRYAPTLAWTVLLIGGLPAALLWVTGVPLPSHRPSPDELLRPLGQPLTSATVVGALTGLLWLIWAAFTTLVLAELLAHLARIRLPRIRLSPLRVMTGGLFGVTVLSATVTPAVAAHASVASDEPAVPTGHTDQPTTRSELTLTTATAQRPRSASDLPTARPAPNVGAPGVVSRGVSSTDTNPEHGSDRPIVQPGDTMSSIARTWLGDANLWPGICDVNWHRHWPTVGGTLRDCDVVYPGWDLKLPTTTTPPPAATQPPPAQPQPAPATTDQPTPTSTPTPPGDSPPVQDPDGVIDPPITTPSHVPSAAPPVTAPSITPPSTTTPTPARTSPPHTAPTTAAPATPTAATTSPPPADNTGIHLPSGSFIPWTLACAITAATALVWLQRRRHFTQHRHTADDERPDLPPTVIELHRQVAHHPDLHLPADLAERAAAVPNLPSLPPGGVGLLGDGAHAAARAAIVSTLASGGPRDPDRRGEVIIDTTTLTTLLGADATALGPWPRLHLANDLDHALSILDSQLVHRARILDEHTLTDLDALREHTPDEEALPPVLFVCHTPPPGATMRAKVSFSLGNGLDISALLLGAWPHGSTITITADGHTRVIEGKPVEAIGDRTAVLDMAEAVAILTTLREAHTGESSNPALRTPAAPRKPAPANDTAIDLDADTELDGDAEPSNQLLDEPPQPPNGKPRPKVHLRVLGTPTVEDVTLPGRSLRGKAAELAVYLAAHPDGADTDTIAEYLFPESRRRPAKQNVHTNASNLRHVLGRAGGQITAGYVLKRGTNARYRLDPTTVHVDLWQLRDLLTRATLASVPTRAALLREACDLYTAPLAEGCDYEWVDPHRETVRQWGTEAHLLLADDLLTTDPQAASDLLDKAIGLDRYNEELYRKAMHARHALGDADGIRALLRAVTNALSDLDTEPTDTTSELAAQLRTSLEQQ